MSALPLHTKALTHDGEWDTELFRMAVEQFERAADVLSLDDDVRVRLLEPRRSLVVNFPVRMDDGSIQTFTGYRVQHTLTMGPTKGGLRYALGVTLGECAALAMWMTWKCALLGLPYGGAKGGVRCDASTLSLDERERLTRRFAAELLPLIGPDEDIPAPDVATGEREMAWFMDTYSQQRGHTVPTIVTGKPAVLGGIETRAAATGLGAAYVTERTATRLGKDIAGLRVVVQGFGNVGSVVASELHRRGAVVVGISDATCALADPEGLDVPALLAHTRAGDGTLRDCRLGAAIAPGALLELPCDVLIPAAIESQITADNAGRLRCSLVVEAANGPTTTMAEEILAARGISIVPDILANSGGVCVSYFEWVQGLQRERWSEEQVAHRMRTQLQEALDEVLAAADLKGLDWRTAAMTVAVARVAHAADARGVYP